jgi:hypothetical protein
LWAWFGTILLPGQLLKAQPLATEARVESAQGPVHFERSLAKLPPTARRVLAQEQLLALLAQQHQQEIGR